MNVQPNNSQQASVTLHIGSTKTGSSALQVLLYRNREALEAAKVLYPDVGIASAAQHVLWGSIHPTAWRMHNENYDIPREEYFSRGMAQIRALATEKNCQHIVLSSEYLWGAFNEAFFLRVRQALRDCNIRVLACVRDPASWVEATYLQALKSGEIRDFAEWYDREHRVPARGFNFFRVLQGWERGIGALSLSVVPYEFEDSNAFLAKMFQEATGIELASMPHKEPSAGVNPSPSAAGMKLLLDLNRSQPPPEERSEKLRAIMKEHGRPPNSKQLYFLNDPSHGAILQNVSQTVNQMDRRQFAGGAAGHDRISRPASLKERVRAGHLMGDDLSPLQFNSPRPGGHEDKIVQYFGLPSCIVRNRDPVLGRGCIMLFTNRSGSNYLAELLQSTGVFSQFGEGLIGDTVVTRSNTHGITSMSEYLTWLKGKKSGEIFGIKASARQAMMLFRFGIVQNMFSSVDWLMTRRKDLVAQAVSLSIAHQTKVWTSGQRGTGATAKYDFEHISKTVRTITLGDALNYQLLNILGCKYQEVYYEDLVDGPERTLQRLMTGLELEYKTPDTSRVRLKKQADGQNSEFKERYLVELRTQLAIG
jgi:LPS sulfotransferase NodH